MRLMFKSTALALTSAVALTVFAFSTAAFAGQAAPAAKSAAKTTKAAKATMITASGTVSKFDSASNTVTVTTAKGDVAFVIDSSATILASGKKIAASDLSNEVGHKVVVRYSESGGQKMAQSLRISAAPKAAAAKKTAAPAAKKS
jgi:hypothetical protein